MRRHGTLLLVYYTNYKSHTIHTLTICETWHSKRRPTSNTRPICNAVKISSKHTTFHNINAISLFVRKINVTWIWRASYLEDWVIHQPGQGDINRVAVKSAPSQPLSRNLKSWMFPPYWSSTRSSLTSPYFPNTSVGSPRNIFLERAIVRGGFEACISSIDILRDEGSAWTALPSLALRRALCLSPHLQIAAPL